MEFLLIFNKDIAELARVYIHTEFSQLFQKQRLSYMDVVVLVENKKIRLVPK